ncbi:sterile alpha motif domain-containing protein 12-like isoform X1 [Sphaerodactylus townsendi]|uniref:sterile alpha motif domain-containing protein 12-like isoform X1 n=1 Tax=Sphaerodactylus townsendi TaxID=933632 RepID=UPI002026C21E|nr:sterile alpha motif domain-containing protein 12-like isoform X1 [Sphaerodactylus townsendi]
MEGSEDDETRRFVGQWTVSEVCAWLDSRPLGVHGGPLLETASNHAISGKALLRLTEETMERMGIVPQSLRKVLMHEILCLRIQQEMEDLLDITDGSDTRLSAAE